MSKVRPNLSSDSLFYFTSKIEYLIDILRNGFQARYNYETIPNINLPLAIPMKCFCDIPLGLSKKHISTYGDFGIGISKEFAMKNGITPLIYVHKDSDTLVKYINEILNSTDNDNSESIIAYFKKYEEYETKNKKIKIRYYDEREWRYIPPDVDVEPLNKIKSEDGRKNFVTKLNEKLPKDKYRLKLDSDDIRYIIVRDDDSIPNVIDTIENEKWLSKTNFKLLLTKFLTKKQIINDF
ncbi:MAG: abortive infection system antitoxin AbiGi family protein [Ignavibacteria bacterium]|jgi:hypothetical protein